MFGKERKDFYDQVNWDPVRTNSIVYHDDYVNENVLHLVQMTVPYQGDPYSVWIEITGCEVVDDVFYAWRADKQDDGSYVDEEVFIAPVSNIAFVRKANPLEIVQYEFGAEMTRTAAEEIRANNEKTEVVIEKVN